MAALNTVIPVVVGVDIGGTNTDAAILHHKDGAPVVLADVKESTSSDVTTGVQRAVLKALLQAKEKGFMVCPFQVNIGTTHFVNAVVQGKGVTKISVIRICGPVSEELPPFCDFPRRLGKIICGSTHLIQGGYRYDGKPHQHLNEQEIRRVIQDIRQRGIRNIAIIGVFSPSRSDQEMKARDIILDEFPGVSVSLSHEIGHIGILERENATILNECLKPLCQKTVEGFASALEEVGVTCPFYLTQNDGTIISSTDVLKFPVLTFASGPTNSMRGAAFLSEKNDAIVVDIGGTTTDVGLLKGGFPREASTHVQVGGVRTNFRMPDVITIGLGGGSYVREQKSSDGTFVGVKVGPLSAGMNLKQEAFVFASDGTMDGRSLTATDIAVSAGLCNMGNQEMLKGLESCVITQAVDEIKRMVEDLVDRIKLGKENLPVIVVGGGSVLIDMKTYFKGASELIIPKYFGVANAIGAALSKVSATSNTVINLLDLIDTREMEKAVLEARKGSFGENDTKKLEVVINEARKPFLANARAKAIEDICEKTKLSVIANGGQADSLEILEKQDYALTYIPGNALEIKVKVIANLARLKTSNINDHLIMWKEPSASLNILANELIFTGKQTVSATGQRIGGNGDEDSEIDPKRFPMDPFIDNVTGEWILSEWDIECIVVGAGIYGCGGGANPHLARLRALNCIRSGKRLRVITPDKLLQNDEKQIIIVSCFIGAPLILYEQGASSSETIKAFECLRDLYEIGHFKDGSLQNDKDVKIETNESGVRFVSNYQSGNQERTGEFKVVGLMSAEIGGLNAIEPFVMAANLDLPVVDGDCMSRAFPEIQMCIPYMYDKPPYPAAIVGSGNFTERGAVLHCSQSKILENYLREVCIEAGCCAGMTIPVHREEVFNKTALYTVSSAWKLGDAVLRARLRKDSVIDAIVKQEDAKHIITGKITDVQRETTGGFNRGFLTVEGVEELKDQVILLEFQNENLVIIALENGKRGACLGSVPDLICVVDADTAEPIPTEGVKYGLRVAVFLMPSHELLRHPKALKWVGPQAFHYPESVAFKPYKKRRITKPIPPV